MVDNGPEFAGRTMDTWAYEHGVDATRIEVDGESVLDVVIRLPVCVCEPRGSECGRRVCSGGWVDADLVDHSRRTCAYGEEMGTAYSSKTNLSSKVLDFVDEVLAVVDRARATWEDEPKHPAHVRPAPQARRRAGRQQESAQNASTGPEAAQAQKQTLRLF